MNTLLNILWFLLGGFLIFGLYLLGGLLLCITIIGIPFGIACFRLSVLAAAPFGRRIKESCARFFRPVDENRNRKTA